MSECTYTVKHWVKVEYFDNSPTSTWGPYSSPEAAESVSEKLAGSPQVVKQVTIERTAEVL